MNTKLSKRQFIALVFEIDKTVPKNMNAENAYDIKQIKSDGVGDSELIQAL